MPDSALAGSGDGPLSGGLSAPRSGCICPVIIAAIPASHGTPPPPPAESRRFSRKELMLRCPPTHSRRGRLWKPCPISRNSPARPSWSSTAATHGVRRTPPGCHVRHHPAVPGWHSGGGGPRRRAGDQRDAEEARPRSRFVDGLRYTDAETMDVSSPSSAARSTRIWWPS